VTLTLLRILGAVVLVAAAPLALTPVVDRRRRRALRRIVTAVCGVLDAHAVEYWADFGTLLGFRREADVILSDKDADLSMLAAAKPQVLALRDAFAREGLDLTDRGGRSRRVLRIYDVRTRYHLDIYTYTPEGDLLRSDLVSPQEDLPARLVARCVAAPFLGGSIRVPDDVDAVLRHRYGDGFTTPRRGDKGVTRPYSVVRSVAEDIEAGWVGIWSWLRSGGV
jgi:hypothetical protein